MGQYRIEVETITENLMEVDSSEASGNNFKFYFLARFLPAGPLGILYLYNLYLSHSKGGSNS